MSFPTKAVIVPALAAAFALAAAGCSGRAVSDGVATTLRDFSIQVADTSLPAGTTKFAITNSGAVVHEFEVFTVPAGVDPAALPIVENVADTATAGLTVVDEVENIAPATGATLNVQLAAGQYVLICNVAGHYALGMHTAITVE